MVFEFKSAIREEEASIHDAYVQLNTRYRRDIPALFVYNAFFVLSVMALTIKWAACMRLMNFSTHGAK